MWGNTSSYLKNYSIRTAKTRMAANNIHVDCLVSQTERVTAMDGGPVDAKSHRFLFLLFVAFGAESNRILV